MTLLAKIALKLAMSGDGRKILFGVVAFALFFAFLLLIAPLAIFSRVPAAGVS